MTVTTIILYDAEHKTYCIKASVDPNAAFFDFHSVGSAKDPETAKAIEAAYRRGFYDHLNYGDAAKGDEGEGE